MSDPLAELNPQQLDAVRHGTGDQAHDTRALLVIAGAGSGKTNTLAHRVAHLVRHGADPQRMMLLTFSRRAAQEMERRVGGVLQRSLRLAPSAALPALPWSGTFHGIGARLLREYAPRIGLQENFTIHDRGDAEDLMGLVRHEIGLAQSKSRFPLKGTCLSIYSRVLNTCEPLARVLQEMYPWCSQWEAELRRLFGAYVEAKQQQNVLDYDDLLLFWFRTSSHSAALELELARRSIPFVKFGGLKFLEAAHVKDLLAVLRFAQNPRGRLAGFRVAQLVPGIGQATATRLLDAMAESAEPGAVVQRFEPPAAAREGWDEFAALYARLRRPASEWPMELELARDWYLPHLERVHDDAQVRKLDLDQLVRLGAGYASRERFLTELTLDPPQATSDEAGVPLLDEDYLVLSTIHSAKGQEWRCVHVLNVVDGCIPSDMATGTTEALEEERRLLYVAMTRAREHLHLVVPHRFYVTQQAGGGDRHVYAARSRFITDPMAQRFEQVTWPQAQSQGAGAVEPAAPVLQVRARARAAWR